MEEKRMYSEEELCAYMLLAANAGAEAFKTGLFRGVYRTIGITAALLAVLYMIGDHKEKQKPKGKRFKEAET